MRIVETAVIGMPPPALTLTLDDEADTARLAQALAASPLLGHCTLSLSGGLGAGKTTFTRHLLRALGAQGRIKSPTYALVEPYEGLPSPHGRLDAWHFDFYRLQDPNELPESGLLEHFAQPGLKLVEWRSQAGASAPPVDLELHWAIDADGLRRHVSLRAESATGQQLLEACPR